MKTTLIITTYNWKEALAVVLDSIKKQTQQPDEVIIADDGSNNETAQLIKQFQYDFPIPLIHCWQEDKGFRAAKIRNKAISKATGDYIIMVDGDMLLSTTFIETHIQNAKLGWFVQGGRVLLNKRLTDSIISTPYIPNFFSSGIKNRKNSIASPLLSKLFSYKKNNANSTRTCNLAVWKKDILNCNGFNNAFVGWGREDSEFVERLLNQGLDRLYLKFAAIAFHLNHKENARQQLPENQRILEQTIQLKKTTCADGINKFIQ